MVFEPVMLLWVWLLGVPLVGAAIEASRAWRYAPSGRDDRQRDHRVTDRARMTTTASDGPITAR
jgi:hypothetical protein